MNTLGERLKSAREQYGWSQAELGRRVGTSGANIGKIERNESKATYLLDALSEALQVRFDWLRTGNEPRHPSTGDPAADLGFRKLVSHLDGAISLTPTHGSRHNIDRACTAAQHQNTNK